MRVDADLAEWLVGGTSCPTGRRVAVVEDPAALAALRGSGWVDRHTRVFLRSRDGYPEPVALDAVPLLTAFRGTFTRPGSRVELSDGYVVERIPYAAAEFQAIDLPTELRVWGPEDYSAFLRDFDMAWRTGTFAGHLTNPFAVLADGEQLALLPAVGPERRIFVAEGGDVATSPTGRRLGRADDDPEVWARTFARWEASAPGAAALGAVLEDRDRRDAAADRPGLPRFLEVVRAHREARRRGRMFSKVSGFGGRLTAGLPWGERPDPVGYPILARAGAHLWMITDPVDGTGHLTVEQTAVLECEVSLDTSRERTAWAFRHLGIPAQRYRTLRSALLGTVSPAESEAR